MSARQAPEEGGRVCRHQQLRDTQRIGQTLRTPRAGRRREVKELRRRQLDRTSAFPNRVCGEKLAGGRGGERDPGHYHVTILPARSPRLHGSFWRLNPHSRCRPWLRRKTQKTPRQNPPITAKMQGRRPTLSNLSAKIHTIPGSHRTLKLQIP